MQNVVNCLEGHPEVCKWPYSSALATTPKIKNLSAKKIKVSHKVPKMISSAFEDDKHIRSQAEYHLSTIKDPLWQKICSEVARMMGSFAVLKISRCRLGSLSSRDSSLNLYCPTKEAMQFIKQYAFVILGALQQYFPRLNKIQAKT